MPAKIKSVGVLAGEGEIPHMLFEHCIKNDIPVCAVQFDGCSYSKFPEIPVLKTKIERVGKIFDFFKIHDVSDIVLIGNISKPKITSLRPDIKGIKTLAHIAQSYLKGDDCLLKSLKSEIESEGFIVRGVDYFVPNLTLSAGVHTKTQPTLDYAKGVIEAIRHGQQDRGQCVLMHPDGCFSYEDRSGTKALIENFARKGSVLIKVTKPQQDPDLDRPTVGLDTMKTLHSKGANGLIIQANSVFAIHGDAMVRYANEHNLFIQAIEIE